MYKRVIGILLLAALMCTVVPVQASAALTSLHLFAFDLPEEFFIPEETMTHKDCAIVCKNVGRVGGFILTDLDVSVLAENEFEPFAEYLRQYVPDGYDFDYMAGFGRVVDVAFILVNLSTMEFREYGHYFFEKDGCVYDFWYDTRCLNGKDVCDILISTGINPNAECVNFQTEPSFDFTAPDGYSFGEVQGRSQPVFMDDTEVGDLSYTGIQPDVFRNSEKDTFWSLVPEEKMEYFEPTPSSFAIERYLAKRHLDMTHFSEYIMMYWGEENPFISVSYYVEDVTTSERTAYSHTFFVKDSCVYDLCLENVLAGENAAALFYKTFGLGN